MHSGTLLCTYGALLVHSCVHSGALMVHLRSGALAVAIFDNVDNTIVSQSVVVGQNCNI